MKVKVNFEFNLEDLIEDDINNLNLIIIWWRFILKTRKLEKENKKVTKEIDFIFYL